MPLDRMIDFTLRAGIFSVGIGILYIVLRFIWLKAKHRPIATRGELLSLAFVLYLAALVQITVIRHGIDWRAVTVTTRGLSTVSLYPLVLTFAELRNGLWAFVYPVVGNMIWFFPLGLLLCAKNPRIRLCQVVWYSAFASCSIEVLQWIFGSGISDIDDILFNIAGAAAGFWAFRWFKKV